MNKKGQAELGVQILLAVIVVFIIGITAVSIATPFLQFLDEFKNDARVSQSNVTVENVEVIEALTPTLLDFIVLFSFLGILLGAIFFALITDASPAVMFVLFLIVIIAVILAAQFANVYDDFSSTSELSAVASQFTFTNFLLGSMFPVIILFSGVLIIIILYTKSRGDTGI